MANPYINPFSNEIQLALRDRATGLLRAGTLRALEMLGQSLDIEYKEGLKDDFTTRELATAWALFLERLNTFGCSL